MRYVLAGVAFLASIVFIIACGAMNWFFWINQGRTWIEGQVLGGISIAVDLFVCVIPFFVRLAVQNQRLVYAWSGRALFSIFFIFSFVSALGFAASNRSVMSEGRQAINHRLEEAAAQLQEKEHSRPKIGGHRPSAVVLALIQKVQQDNRYQNSQQCAVPWPEIRKFCQDFADLKVELANAQEEDRLAANVERLRQEIVTLTLNGGGQPKDAQAALIATLTGFHEHTAENILSFAVALLVELGAAFGLYLATGWLPAVQEKTSPRGRDASRTTTPSFGPLPPEKNEGVALPPVFMADKAPRIEDRTAEQVPPRPKKPRAKKKPVQKAAETIEPLRLLIDGDGGLHVKE